MNHNNIKVEIVADSINPAGQRITSALWTYPRFIHSEIMTHRALSKNAASSRAIPVTKVIQAVQENPATPEWWGKKQIGMQANDQLSTDEIEECKKIWLANRDNTIQYSEQLMRAGLHKQIANRVLEPWFRITVLVTATDWDNFFALRAHPAAQPEFQVLAYRMLDAMVNKSTPREVDWMDWHIPFDPDCSWDLADRLTVSVAKAARTSYVAFDSDKTLQEQTALFNAMRDSGHWSPFEHQAQAQQSLIRSGNFTNGWAQYRQSFSGHTRSVPSLDELLLSKPDWIAL